MFCRGSDSPYIMGLRAVVGIYLRGLAMGAADSVPGVSGGTIALITGIYDRLIEAIAAVRTGTVRDLVWPPAGDRRREAATQLDVGFLLALGAGIMSAFIVAAETLTRATTQYPGITYAFFFGLIAASAVLFGRQVRWTPPRIGGAGLAAGLVGLLSVATATTGQEAYWLVFLSGAIAISAMVLPGLSGALLLVILGQYEFLLSAFRETLSVVYTGAIVRESVAVVVVFLTGAVLGLVTVARLVSYAFKQNRETTLAVLLGLLVGGCVQPLLRVQAATAEGTTLWVVVLSALFGGVAVGLLDYLAGGLEYA